MSGNFQPARRTVRLPAGAVPAGSRQVSAGRRPRAYVPYAQVSEPNSHVGMFGLCLLVVGLRTMAAPAGVPGWVAGFLFFLLGVVLGGSWLRLWWLWRRAWGGGRWL